MKPSPTSGRDVSDVGAGARALRCQRCGAAFECRPADCWCAAESVRLPMPAAESGEDCLCPACLRAAAAGQRY
jgi:hypothetical protein